MRKKLLATLLVGAIAATSVIGFTACNNGNGNGTENGNETVDEGVIQKGEQVTDTQWKSAFEETVEAENYTILTTMENKTVGTKQDDATVKYTYTESQSAKFYLDIAGATKHQLTDISYTTKSEGGAAVGEEDVDYSNTSKAYSLVDGNSVWQCALQTTDSEWAAYKSEYSSETAAKESLARFGTASALNVNVSTTEGGEETTLNQLYSAFTYANGFYTATLYSHGVDGAIDFTISLKDGYVSCIQYEVNTTGEDDGLTVLI